MEQIVFNALDNHADRLASLQPPPQQMSASGPVQRTGEGTDSNVRFARIELTKFSVKITDWQPFKDMFVSLVKK